MEDTHKKRTRAPPSLLKDYFGSISGLAQAILANEEELKSGK